MNTNTICPTCDGHGKCFTWCPRRPTRHAQCICCGVDPPAPGRTICADCIVADCLISVGCDRPASDFDPAITRVRYIGTIGPEHLHTIGARFNYGGREYWLRDAIGRVLPGDVGKRAYIVRNDADDSWVLQVENDRQRDERLAKEATP